ncbi:hypothetical protein F4778DRAFT_785315 [Xylariomycetidae sp. FL2044]|nr:hypothetical protein F4778DRAFT_785315 [Xylariomycetidae sp. FL2044]
MSSQPRSSGASSSSSSSLSSSSASDSVGPAGSFEEGGPLELDGPAGPMEIAEPDDDEGSNGNHDSGGDGDPEIDEALSNEISEQSKDWGNENQHQSDEEPENPDPQDNNDDDDGDDSDYLMTTTDIDSEDESEAGVNPPPPEPRTAGAAVPCDKPTCRSQILHYRSLDQEHRALQASQNALATRNTRLEQEKQDLEKDLGTQIRELNQRIQKLLNRTREPVVISSLLVEPTVRLTKTIPLSKKMPLGKTLHLNDINGDSMTGRLLDQAPFRFDDLPVDIQLRIFRMIFIQRKLVHCLSRLDPNGPPPDLPPYDGNRRCGFPNRFHFGRKPCVINEALRPNEVLQPLLVSKRWFFIGVHAFYGGNTFAFSSLGEFGRFCTGIGRARVQRLVNLELFWHGALMQPHETNVSRRTYGLRWFCQTQRLRTVVVHIQEDSKDRVRRRYEQQKRKDYTKNFAEVRETEAYETSDEEAEENRVLKDDVYAMMTRRTDLQPNHRRMRSMRTTHGIDYLYQLRGMKWIRFKESHGTERRQNIRDWSFLTDMNNVTTQPKDRRDALKSELVNLPPLTGLSAWDPSPDDMQIIRAFYDETPIESVGGSDTSSSDRASTMDLDLPPTPPDTPTDNGVDRDSSDSDSDSDSSSDPDGGEGMADSNLPPYNPNGFDSPPPSSPCRPRPSTRGRGRGGARRGGGQGRRAPLRKTQGGRVTKPQQKGRAGTQSRRAPQKKGKAIQGAVDLSSSDSSEAESNSSSSTSSTSSDSSSGSDSHDSPTPIPPRRPNGGGPPLGGSGPIDLTLDSDDEDDAPRPNNDNDDSESLFVQSVTCYGDTTTSADELVFMGGRQRGRSVAGPSNAPRSRLSTHMELDEDDDEESLFVHSIDTNAQLGFRGRNNNNGLSGRNRNNNYNYNNNNTNNNRVHHPIVDLTADDDDDDDDEVKLIKSEDDSTDRPGEQQSRSAQGSSRGTRTGTGTGTSLSGASSSRGSGARIAHTARRSRFAPVITRPGRSGEVIVLDEDEDEDEDRGGGGGEGGTTTKNDGAKLARAADETSRAGGSGGETSRDNGGGSGSGGSGGGGSGSGGINNDPSQPSKDDSAKPSRVEPGSSSKPKPKPLGDDGKSTSASASASDEESSDTCLKKLVASGSAGRGKRRASDATSNNSNDNNNNSTGSSKRTKHEDNNLA